MIKSFLAFLACLIGFCATDTAQEILVVHDNKASLKQVKHKAKPLLITSNDLKNKSCLLYTSPSPRDRTRSRMPSSA